MEFCKDKNGCFYFTGPDKIKIGVAAKNVNNTDYTKSGTQVRKQEKALLHKITGIKKKNIIMLNQVHGDDIVIIDDHPSRDLPFIAEADGMITAVKGLCLVIRTADCVPVIVHDINHGVLGAIHSGWRGCRLSISKKMILMMERHYGSRPGDIRVFILPAIGPESYTVNTDVAAFFPRHITKKNEKLYLNLWENIRSEMREAGISGERIHTAGLCSLSANDKFFSHRGGDNGRNLNFCYLAEQL